MTQAISKIFRNCVHRMMHGYHYDGLSSSPIVYELWKEGTRPYVVSIDVGRGTTPVLARM